MNVPLMKKLDESVGQLAALLIPLPAAKESSQLVTSLLLIRPGGIGDAVLLAPAIRHLKKHSPEIKITMLAEQRNAGIFPLIEGVDGVLCYDRPGEFYSVFCSRFDAVIDSEQWHRLSAVVARFITSPMKVGFDTNERRRMFTHPVPYSHNDYEAASFARLLKPLGMVPEDVDMSAPFLSVPPRNSVKADALLESLHNQPFITLFPGASIMERRWGSGRFRQIAELLARVGIKTVVVGGKEDRLQGDEIVAGGEGVNLAGQTNLAETAAVLAKSALLLSGDSGVLHIAVGLNVPTVSLFGPGRALKWAPTGEHHIVINKGLDCSPCTTFGTTPACPNDARCMRDITVDEVFNAVTILLTSLGTIPSHCCKRDWIERTGAGS